MYSPVTGTPAVLVPWAASAEDHQTLNVSWLSDAGAAIQLAEADAGRLPELIERFRYDHEARQALATRAREMGDVHRSGALAQLVESVALA